MQKRHSETDCSDARKSRNRCVSILLQRMAVACRRIVSLSTQRHVDECRSASPLGVVSQHVFGWIQTQIRSIDTPNPEQKNP